MKTLIVIAVPILASAAFAFDNSSRVAKSTMNCSDHSCCRLTNVGTAVARIPHVTADPGAELRYRMKYGRNTPAEEARQKAAQDYANHTADRAEEGCCSGLRAKLVTAETPLERADSGAELRYRMKYGRNTPAEERHQAGKSENAERMLLASAERMICTADCCKHER